MLQIIPLSEGSFTIAADKKFIPFDTTTDELTDRITGSLLVEVQPFLIIKNEDYILLDTGLGVEINDTLQIHHNLRANGIEPHQITKVIMSHLHKDHAGGLCYLDAFGQWQMSFPNATHYIYQAEFDYALSNTTKSYDTQDFHILKNNKQVVFYSQENGMLTDGIYHNISGGHSKFHQTIKITDGTETIFYAGDEASQLKQLKVKFMAKYDFDGRKASELRVAYAQEGKKNNWKFLFYHDIQTPYATL